MVLTGGCLCGQVRYELADRPARAGVCHCRDCQRSSGSAFAVFVGVPKESAAIRGTLNTFHGRGDSGRPLERSFCPACGSQVTVAGPFRPDMAFFTAGTLDDPSAVRPAVQIWCDSAQPWVELGGNIERVAKEPA